MRRFDSDPRLQFSTSENGVADNSEHRSSMLVPTGGLSANGAGQASFPEKPIIVRVGRPRELPSIKLLERPNGRRVWRVLATIAGKQRKRIVGSAEEANLVAYQWASAQQSDLRILPTRLTPSELREAEAAMVILQQAQIGLLEGARWLLVHFQRPSGVSWATAISEYEADRARIGISPSQVSNVAKAARRLAGYLKRAEIGDPSSGEIEKFLADTLPSAPAPTYNGLLGNIRTFLRWMVSREYLAADPTEGIERRRLQRHLPDILPPDKAECLLRDVEASSPEWLPYLACCLFGAIRPGTRAGEALRLDSDLRAGRTVLHPGGVEVHGKAHGTRIVPWSLTGPLRSWLAAYPPKEGLWPARSGPQAERWWAEIRDRHALSPDILRHTGISAMCYAPGASLAQVAIAVGNSETMIRRHYLGRWSAEDTARLWGIRPGRPEGLS